MSSNGGGIQPMPADAVRRIVAGQAVTDLASAVKELVDNALDAGSSSINIRLFNQGADVVEVSDDGFGVPLASRPFLATPHATSKIRSFDDIYSQQEHSLGFRGEALFCLANLSGSLMVATRTAEEPMAHKMAFGRDGVLLSTQDMPRKIGTTVAVVRLLEAVPVRRADLLRTLPKQRGKLVKCMEAYAIFSTHARIHLMDIVNDDQEKTLLATTANPNKTLAETISSVMGARFLQSLTPLDISLCDVFPATTATSSSDCKIDGYISTAIPSSSSTAQKPPTRPVQYHCINGRPVHLPNVNRLLNHIWKNSFGQAKKPSCLLRFTLPPDAFDINVDADKRHVIFTNEQAILDKLQHAVSVQWSSQTNGRFAEQLMAAAAADNEREDDEINSRAAATASTPTSPAATNTNNSNHNSDDGALPRSPDGLFQRRNAFAHDLAQAKLQHETTSLERRKRSRRGTLAQASMDTTYSGSPDKNNNEQQQELSPIDNDDFDDDDDVPLTAEQLEAREVCRKRQRTLLASSSSPSTTAMTVDYDNNMPQWSSSLSLEEQRQWQQAQIAFNQKQPAALQQDMASLQPTQRQQQHPRSNDTNQKLTQFGFQELGYRQTVKRVSVDPLAGNNHKQQSHDNNNKKIQSPSLPTPETLSPSGARRVSALDEEQSFAEDDDDEKVQAVEQPKQPPLVWGSFRNTHDIVASSRRHRLAIRDRRRAFRRSMARTNLKAQQQSAGNGNDKKETTPPSPSAAASPTRKPGKRFITLSKQDFKENMTVIGQFNMGFILAKTRDNHIWILDQHACDEKYNFEKLCRETVLHEQRLMAPLPLELSPAEEICVLDHMDVFEKNGFRFQVDETKPPRHRLALTSLPHSGARHGRKAVQFGKEDVAALCAVLGADGSSSSYGDSGGTGTDGSGKYGNNAVRRHAGSLQGGSDDRVLVRLPKAIAMFASRACRGSIMIGKALSEAEMTEIVKRLGDLEEPWRCPHGRTTLNHVGDMRSLFWKDEQRAAAQIAGPTLTVMSQEDSSRRSSC